MVVMCFQSVYDIYILLYHSLNYLRDGIELQLAVTDSMLQHLVMEIL